MKRIERVNRKPPIIPILFILCLIVSPMVVLADPAEDPSDDEGVIDYGDVKIRGVEWKLYTSPNGTVQVFGPSTNSSLGRNQITVWSIAVFGIKKITLEENGAFSQAISAGGMDVHYATPSGKWHNMTFKNETEILLTLNYKVGNERIFDVIFMPDLPQPKPQKDLTTLISEAFTFTLPQVTLLVAGMVIAIFVFAFLIYEYKRKARHGRWISAPDNNEPFSRYLDAQMHGGQSTEEIEGPDMIVREDMEEIERLNEREKRRRIFKYIAATLAGIAFVAITVYTGPYFVGGFAIGGIAGTINYLRVIRFEEYLVLAPEFDEGGIKGFKDITLSAGAVDEYAWTGGPMREYGISGSKKRIIPANDFNDREIKLPLRIETWHGLAAWDGYMVPRLAEENDKLLEGLTKAEMQLERRKNFETYKLICEEFAASERRPAEYDVRKIDTEQSELRRQNVQEIMKSSEDEIRRRMKGEDNPAKQGLFGRLGGRKRK